MQVTERSIEQSEALLERLATERLPQRIAKLYSQHARLSDGREGLRAWLPSEASDRLEEALRLIDASLVTRNAGNTAGRRGMRRAAEILEWLSIDQLNTAALPVGLLSAAAYQIAGYPARSWSLIKNQPDGRSSRILSSFLSGDFRSVLERAVEFWTGSVAMGREVAQDGAPLALDGEVVTRTVSAIGVICGFLRWGEDGRVTQASETLDLVRGLSASGDPYSYLLSSLTTEVAQTILSTCLRRVAAELPAILDDRGSIALDRYFRLAFQGNRSICWPSQVEGISRVLGGGDFALCTPTGSGKTTVAELAILTALFERSVGSPVLAEPIALYLVPSRALASEVEARLSSVFRRLGAGVPVTVTSLYGGTDWGPTDAWLTRDLPTVLICTYEKAEALIRFVGPQFQHRLSLVVIDEAHNVNAGEPGEVDRRDNRPLRVESLVSRLLAMPRIRQLRVIALSAVAGGVETALSAWATGDATASAVHTAYRSTRQLVGRLECSARRFTIRYDLLDGSNLRFGSSDDDTLFVRDPFPVCPEIGGFSGPEKRLRPYLFWAAIHLAAPDAHGRSRTVLISIAQKPEGYAKDLLDLLDGPFAGAGPSYFSPPAADSPEEILWHRCLASCEDYFGVQSREYRLLARGIVVHHGKMPGLMARLLVQVIQSGIVRIVMATSTLSEGVNLPFDIVLVPTLRRQNSAMSAREFANLVGRAGRPGYALEGRTLVLIDTASNDWSARQAVERYWSIIRDLEDASRQNDAQRRSPIAQLVRALAAGWRSVYKDGTPDRFEEWLEVTLTTDSSNVASDTTLTDAVEALDTLDGILLSAIVEAENVANTPDISLVAIEDRLRSVWQRTYARYADASEQVIGDIFVTRGKALHQRLYPDAQHRRRLYRTSLAPRSGHVLLSQINRIREQIELGHDFLSWDAAARFNFICLLAEVLSGVPAFSGMINGADDLNILRWWLDPSNAPKAPRETEVTKWQDYVSKQFIYRFNWAVGSAVSLLLDKPDANLRDNDTIAEMEASGLPWISFWVKELVTWGTLDPVAAYLLSRKVAYTRGEALGLASEYYVTSDAKKIDPNEQMNPVRIREWVDALIGNRAGNARPTFNPISAVLSRDFSKAPKKIWRVLPGVHDGKVIWFDCGGFEMARSKLPPTWQSTFLHQMDFVLDSEKGQVVGVTYL